LQPTAFVTAASATQRRDESGLRRRSLRSQPAPAVSPQFTLLLRDASAHLANSFHLLVYFIILMYYIYMMFL